MNDSDEENAIFRTVRMDVLFARRQKNELRIANDGTAYPYHEFMRHYLGKCDWYWERAKALPSKTK